MARDKLSLVERALYEPWVERPENEITVTDRWARLVTPGVPAPLQNAVARSVLAEAEVDERVAETIALSRSLKVPFWWLVTPSTRPSDMGSRLLASGFQHVSMAVGVIADPAKVRIVAPDGLHVEVVEEHNLEDWISVHAAGWSLPPAGVEHVRKDALRRAAERDPGRIDLLVRVDGAPCGAGSIRFLEGYALLIGSVVLPPFRGRGAFHARLSASLDILASRGIPIVVGHAVKDTSAPIYRRLGFEDVCEIAYYRYG